MKIYRYWHQHEESLLGPDPSTGLFAQRVYRFVGGSSISKEDARLNALNKVDVVKRRIAGQLEKYPEDYAVGIKEEIVKELDDHNTVTVNRYGADVLNSANIMFIDVDEAGLSSRIGLFTSLLYRFKKKNDEPLAMFHFRKMAKKPEYNKLNFRIYQTAAGYRILVLGQAFDPLWDLSRQLMSDFGSDYLYSELCKKQVCYRARLTPKPKRINMKGHRVIFPFRTEEQTAQFEQWRQMYQEASERFAVCRLLETIGTDRPNAIVMYHDNVCKVSFTQLPLA